MKWRYRKRERKRQENREGSERFLTSSILQVAEGKERENGVIR